MTAKEQFDIRTMRYFIPRLSKYKNVRITKKTEQEMVDLSGRGIQPEHKGEALQNLIWGKTYRDLQISEWKDGVRHGYFTKYEIIQSVPKWMRSWVEGKLRKVPYDEDYNTSRMLIKMYQDEIHDKA